MSDREVLGDVARQRAGLDTAADRQSEEQFLFEIATSRATEETVLSYPRFMFRMLQAQARRLRNANRWRN